MTVMITLNQIRAASLPIDGGKRVSEVHEHLGIDVPFPLSSVLDSNGLDDALWCFRAIPYPIEIPKRFAIWCARQVQHLMTDCSVNTLDIAERYLDGNATMEELKAATNVAYAVARTADASTYAAAYTAVYATWAVARIGNAASDAVDAARAARTAAADMKQKQIDKLREMLNA